MDDMLNDQETLKIKTRTKMLKSYVQSFQATHLVDWLFKHCKFLDRLEAIRLAEFMYTYRFIICIEDTTTLTFTDESLLYTLQMPRFWVNENLEAADIDYCAYLIRRSSEQSIKLCKNPLSTVEAERLNRLKL